MKTNLLSGKLSNLLGGKRMKKLLVVLAVLGLATTAFATVGSGPNQWRYSNGPGRSPYLTSATIYDISFCKDTISGHPYGATDSTPVGFAVGGIDGGQGTVLFTTNGGSTWLRRQTRWGGAIRAILLSRRGPAGASDSLRAIICGDGGYVARSVCRNDTHSIRSWGTTWTRLAVPDSNVNYVAMAMPWGPAGKDTVTNPNAYRSAVVVGWKNNGTVKILSTNNIFRSDSVCPRWTAVTVTGYAWPVYSAAMYGFPTAWDTLTQRVIIAGAGGTRVISGVFQKFYSSSTGAVSPPMYAVLARFGNAGDSAHVMIGGGRGTFMWSTPKDSEATVTGISDDSTVLHVAAKKLSSVYNGGFLVMKDSTRALPIATATNDSVITLYANTTIKADAPGCDSAKKALDTLKFHLDGASLTGYAGGYAHFYTTSTPPCDSVVYIRRVSNDSLFTTGQHTGGAAMDSIRIYKVVPESLRLHGVVPTTSVVKLFSNAAFTNVASGFNSQNILRIAYNQAKTGAADSTTYWIVGSGGLFAKSTNRGVTWATVRTGRALSDLYSICVRDTDKIWIGGRYGVIMRYGKP